MAGLRRQEAQVDLYCGPYRRVSRAVVKVFGGMRPSRPSMRPCSRRASRPGARWILSTRFHAAVEGARRQGAQDGLRCGAHRRAPAHQLEELDDRTRVDLPRGHARGGHRGPVHGGSCRRVLRPAVEKGFDDKEFESTLAAEPSDEYPVQQWKEFDGEEPSRPSSRPCSRRALRSCAGWTRSTVWPCGGWRSSTAKCSSRPSLRILLTTIPRTR